MDTVEEGFSITKTRIDDYDEVLTSNFRGTELTEAEEMKGGWGQTTEDVLVRAREEFMGVNDPIVQALKFLLNVIEHQDRVIYELTNKPKI